jgi:hypothetical protein
MSKVLCLVIAIVAAGASVSAQTEATTKKSFQVESNSLRIARNASNESAEEAAVIRETAYRYPADEFKPGVVKVGPRTTYLKEGLSTAEVVRLLGKPAAVSERSERDVLTTIFEFPRSEGQVLIAEFVKDKLVRATLAAREQVARGELERED